MSSHHRSRDNSVSATHHHERRRSSGRSSRRSTKSSSSRREMALQNGFSSGYGTGDSELSLSTSSLPPPYYDVYTASEPSSHIGHISENLYETIREDIPQETSRGTFIRTEDPVSAVRFSNRYHGFSAPDMILDRLPSESESLTAVVDGRSVDYTAMPVLNSMEGKMLLVDHAEKRIKLPTKVARNSVFLNTEYEVAFLYRLQTQVEQRLLEIQTKPYRGEKLGACCRQSAWDYDIDCHRPFAEGEEYHKVPGSEKVITCKLCDGNGKGKCANCNGYGHNTCSRCHGFGREPMSNTECLQCGDGFETCIDCHGVGIGKCRECEGRGKVIAYQRLKVTWILKNHVHVDSIDGVPKKRLAAAEGRLIHKDVAKGCVKPLTEEKLFHSKIIRDSTRQIAKYDNINGSVRRQRQTVHLVLVQRFDCQYKEKPFSFHVIGMDKKVYAPQYPNRRLKFLDFFTGKK